MTNGTDDFDDFEDSDTERAAIEMRLDAIHKTLLDIKANTRGSFRDLVFTSAVRAVETAVGMAIGLWVYFHALG